MNYYSFIMFKPDAIQRGLVKKIWGRFLKEGYQAILFDCRLADMQTMKHHYEANIIQIGEKFITMVENSFSEKYVMPVLVAHKRNDIVEHIRKIVGATNPAKAEKGTIRGDFGIDSYEKVGKELRCVNNLIHASDSIEAVKREALLWFGEQAKEFFK